MNKSWWIWCGWYVPNEGRSVFIYGCLAQTHRQDKDYSSKQEFSYEGLGKLYCEEAIVDIAKAQEFIASLKSRKIPAKFFFKDMPEVFFSNERITLQEALGQINVPTDVYHSVPEIKKNLGLRFKDTLIAILKTLEEELNQPFKKECPGKLGSFEVFHLHPWLDHANPFLVDMDRSQKETQPDTFYVYRSAEYADRQHSVHIKFKAGNDIVAERLLNLLPKQTKSAPIKLSARADAYQSWVFEGDSLIDYDKAHYLSQIHMGMNISTGTSKDKTSMQQVLDVRSFKDVRNFEDEIVNIISENNENKKTRSKDRFFPTAINNKNETVAYIASLIKSPECVEAILIDPYFDHIALERFMPLLERSTINITILTNLVIQNDKNSDALDKEEELKGDAFRKAIDNNRMNLSPNVKILNFKRGQKQAFHDRYLIRCLNTGTREAYLLSNSLNFLAEKWPFCVSLIDQEETSDLFKYVDGLSGAKDVFRNKAFDVTFRWPPAND